MGRDFVTSAKSVSYYPQSLLADGVPRQAHLKCLFPSCEIGRACGGIRRYPHAFVVHVRHVPVPADDRPVHAACDRHAFQSSVLPYEQPNRCRGRLFPGMDRTRGADSRQSQSAREHSVQGQCPRIRARCGPRIACAWGDRVPGEYARGNGPFIPHIGEIGCRATHEQVDRHFSVRAMAEKYVPTYRALGAGK
jgi:hypothetical protein